MANFCSSTATSPPDTSDIYIWDWTEVLHQDLNHDTGKLAHGSLVESSQASSPADPNSSAQVATTAAHTSSSAVSSAAYSPVSDYGIPDVSLQAGKQWPASTLEDGCKTTLRRKEQNRAACASFLRRHLSTCADVSAGNEPSRFARETSCSICLSE